MKVIIAGSRTVTDTEYVESCIARAIAINDIKITEVVSGVARGVDVIGERWADKAGIPIKRFPANWRVYGKKAGPIRNTEMAGYADVLIAVWDGESRGTASMIAAMRSLRKPVFTFKFKEKQ